MENFIFNGSCFEFSCGVALCKSFNGVRVSGILYFDNGNQAEFSYTLSEIAHLMYEVDGKDHHVFWRNKK